MVLLKNYAILRPKPYFTVKWNTLSTQNEIIFFNIPLISLKNVMFYLLVENLWLTDASLTSMQFSRDTDFDKGKLIAMAFLSNLLVT